MAQEWQNFASSFANKPWPSDNLWDAVWVTGQMQHELQSTEVAETGYLLKAEEMETYVW
ncbi:DUF3299 domain-containing protein [Ascidiaceihabitans sp.]|nr:DUF3299 domain-containing protein [Ascidiaceihabitans sp.]